MVAVTKLAFLLSASAVYAQQTQWGQCGGEGWTGPTNCIAGWTCVYSNPWYSQCLQGSSSTTTTTTTTRTTTTTTTTTKPRTTTTTTTSSQSSAPPTTLITTTTPPPTTTTVGSPSTTIGGPTGVAGSGPGTTLVSGWYWIRSVESPNFHQYLQTDPEYTTGTAIMDNYTSAGQFNIINGQLVELITGGQLYANVEVQPNSTVMTLAVTFETTQNTYGTFSWSGDAVEWTVPSITRPNPAAWYVCTNQQLFINLGNYDYLTPSNCADETIHYYNGATAVD